MAYRFPFRFPRRKRIKRLTKSPHSSIKRWLKEKKKTISIDPLKRKKKTTKEKKIAVDNLRTVISQLYSKVNELVEHVQERPEELERILFWEIDTREKEIRLLTAKHDREIKELYNEFDRRVKNNRRLIVANSALDFQDRKNLQLNTLGDVQLRSQFRMHKNTPPVSPFPPFMPLTHYPGTIFEEGGKISTDGMRYEFDNKSEKKERERFEM